MPWPVHPNGLLGAQGDNDTYQIQRSLRFNSADNAYLNRTPSSASNQKTYTFNFWVKRSSISLASDVEVFSAVFASTSLRYAYISFEADDTLSFFSGIYSTGASTTTSYSYKTTQVFRDISSWYMITAVVDTTNATASERVKLYVNGVQITSFSTATQPSLNQNGYWNSTQFHAIGCFNGSTAFSPVYLAEINFIDGQALTPSSFGETDSITGRWKAKAYSGTYGTNGYYLKFADNSGTTATTLGKDSSGNGNNWTPNNFSVTAGVGNDSLVDSPTNYGTDTGVGGEVRGNYCTLNPIDRNTTATLSNGNLDFATATSGHNAIGTIGVSSGKWYWEAQTSAGTTEARATVFGTAASSYYSFAANNTAYGFRFDAGAGTLEYTTNGSTWTSLATGLISGPYFPFFNNNGTTSKTISINFGQRPFAYTAPTGFKALCTTNLSKPTIQKPSRYMDVIAYTGTGASNSISSLGFSPDLVWIKNRGTTTSHAIYDTTRGAQTQLSSDTTVDEVTSSTGLTAFGSNGFTVGTSSLVNTSGTQYVAWAWDEAPIAGMDIVSYTGSGANRTIVHNLGVAPKMVIVKARTTAGADQGWPVWHTSIANTTYLGLNSTSGTATATDYWNSTSPTSSVFSVGTSAAVNTNNDTYIAYLFAEVEGFSKFGSYTGNGSADGPFVWCGFSPKYLLVKRTDLAGQNWIIFDTVRKSINDSNRTILSAEASAAETTDAFPTDIISNGFKVRNTGTGANASGATYIFAAFAESPFKYARAR